MFNKHNAPFSDFVVLLFVESYFGVSKYKSKFYKLLVNPTEEIFEDVLGKVEHDEKFIIPMECFWSDTEEGIPYGKGRYYCEEVECYYDENEECYYDIEHQY